MSWTEITAKPGPARLDEPIIVSCKPGTSRTSPADRLTVTFRPELLGPESAWLAGKPKVKVLVGGGEHQGQIRVERNSGGAHMLHVSGGRHVQSLVRPCLVLRGLSWIPAQRHPATAVDHDAGEGWVEITLPTWCATPPVGIQVSAIADVRTAPVTRPNGTYSGVDHLPDPVALGRRGVGPVSKR